MRHAAMFEQDALSIPSNTTGTAGPAPHPEPRQAAARGYELSIVVPMHDEVENVGPFLEEIAATLGDRYRYQVVIVDDASRDGTLAALRQAAPDYANLVVLHHSERCGKSAAVHTGVKAARAPVIVLMDGDRQNDPADIPQLVEKLRDGRAHDPRLAMVAGQRAKRADTTVRRLSSRLANGLRSRVLRDGTRDTGCGLKVITRDAFLALPFFDGQHRFMSALVKALGAEVALCDVADRPRAAGLAKYGIWNRLWVGIGDLATVAWLTRRCSRPQQIEWVVGDPEPGDGKARE